MRTLVALVFTLGYVFHSGDGPASTRQEPTEIDGSNVDLSTLQQIINILDEDYINRDNLDQQALYEAAIQGMLDSLADTGTFYIDPVTYQLSVGPTGSFEGIGATVQEQNNQIVIVRPFEGRGL